MTRHYFIATMGCQMNEYDSDYLGQVLQDSEFLHTDDPNEADLILINTCAVRAKAEQKAYSLLGRMRSLKKRKPSLILGLVGCMAQQEGDRLIKKFPYLDLVLGTREVGRIQEVLQGLESNGKKAVATDLESKIPPPVNRPGYFSGRVKGYISIMEGCNNFCSYCIVPYVRGREVSRSPEDILNEAVNLVSQGIKEITLLGQNVNSYCSGEKERVRFPHLLRRLNNLDDLLRIRFTTSHPKDLSDELIQCFDELDKLCPHIHLPVQAGSNRILALMNRGYTRETYIELIANLRDVRPEMSITSDIIVGFPGESDADFQMTLDLLRKIEFDNTFSFKYSDRKGTIAEKMTGKVDDKTKSDRLSRLQVLQKDITLEKNKRLEGEEVAILVDGHSRKGGQLTGRTGTNKIVNFNCNNEIISSIVKVKIKHSFVNSLRGELLTR